MNGEPPLSNYPPDMTATASDVMNQMSDWLSENPVIQEEHQAREAKLYLDRGKLCIQDLEAERDSKVRPLNEQVAATNAYYKESREPLRRVLDILGGRLHDFIRAETEKREAIAEAARKKAEEAKRLAREAEEEERNKLEDAAAGELDIDVAKVTGDADQKFSDFQRAQREVALAERETRVKIGGGIGRAIGLREKETLVLDNIRAALDDLGVTEDIREAVLKGARTFKRLHNRLPKGVSSTWESKI